MVRFRSLPQPRVEGAVRLDDGRRIGFAEFGDPHGRTFVWLHGTPGARRQIPPQARALAESDGLRLIGLDRPGVGRSSAHLYASVSEFSADLRTVADTLGIERMGLIGLSGGGPFALAAGALMPERVAVIGVLGGVAPTRGPDQVGGGLVSLGARFAPLILASRVPLGVGLSYGVKLLIPFGNPLASMFGRVSPPEDRRILNTPEMRAMFLDDLVSGGQRQMQAPLADILAFSRDWGFTLGDVARPVLWWHGDADQIVPFRHGEHCVARLPDAELRRLPGISHLSLLGIAEEVLTTLVARWDGAGRAEAAPAI